jgi:hypothetical protein
MIQLGSSFVVLACTLAGGIEREVVAVPSNASCGIGTRWAECGALDEGIQTHHLAIPWLLTLGAIIVLSMPTLLLRSKLKEKGLSLIAWNLMQFLGLMIASTVFTDHPSICFALSLHSCVLLLEHLNVSKALLGGNWWWGLRHVVSSVLLVWEVCVGPAISVVTWPGMTQKQVLPCAYLAHLAGAIIPGCVLTVLRWILFCARCMCLHEE